jgi:hypothetical protein
MAEQQSDIQKSIESAGGSDPANRSSPFTDGKDLDLSDHALARLEQEQQRAASPEPAPEPASEEPRPVETPRIIKPSLSAPSAT